MGCISHHFLVYCGATAASNRATLHLLYYPQPGSTETMELGAWSPNALREQCELENIIFGMEGYDKICLDAGGVYSDTNRATGAHRRWRGVPRRTRRGQGPRPPTARASRVGAPEAGVTRPIGVGSSRE